MERRRRNKPMYAEQLEKLNYYKERIIKEFARNGIHPDNVMIKNRLDKIDKSIAIYQPYTKMEGTAFDPADFNEDLRQTLCDLKILYKLAYRLAIKDFGTIRAYVETHLTQLETLARHYQRKTQLEMDGTYLGKTIFFQTYGYQISGENGVRTIDLGQIEVTPQSTLACLFIPREQNFTMQNVSFVFTDQNGKTLSCSPYSVNKDTLYVPGKSNTTTYSYTPPKNAIISSSFQLTPEGLTVNRNNTYLVYAGKWRIATGGAFDRTYLYKTSGVAMTFESAGTITFYVLNGTYINFDFSDTPKSTNFNGTAVKNLPDHEKIVIEHDTNFTMNFQTDGTIYATCVYAYVKGDALYYPVRTNLDDFLIEEYSAADKETWNAKVIVNNMFSSTFRIQEIAIKETNKLREDGIVS